MMLNQPFNLQEAHNKSAAAKPGMPLVMGILNVTPDSFSDGGLYQEMDAIQQQVRQMVDDGVDIIDVGGESTRPGAEAVPLEVELNRVIPVIRWIAKNVNVPISIDTYKPEVMRQAIEAGAAIVNDVNALLEEGALEVVAKAGVSVCLMHKKGTPQTMQDAPEYENVVAEVTEFLGSRAQACIDAGIAQEKIILDPGFGFGKRLTHNTELFSELMELNELGYPLLVGVSRKRMIGEILNNAPVEERLHGSVAAAVLAAMKGASIVRVHDVKPTVEALKVISHLL
jgi:dihydropteroate synthase